MDVYREINKNGSSFELFIKVLFSDAELRELKSYNLMNVKIRLKDLSPTGKSLTFPNLASAFQAQIGKIKNRWSVAFARTTGFILIDTIWASVALIGFIIHFLFRTIFGRRKRVSNLIQGIRYKSRRIEKVKEAEFFILSSIAAVEKAIDYARKAGTAETFTDGRYLGEIAGLNFSGAGSYPTDDELAQSFEHIAEEVIKSAASN